MSKKQKRIIWSVLVIAGLALCSVVAGSSSRAPTATGKTSAAATSRIAPERPFVVGATRKERLGYEVITVTRFGFEPTEIRRTVGQFILSIENRSGIHNLVLRLDPEHGARVREVSQPLDQLDWADELKLPPGRYQLTEVNHPRWVCHVTIVTP